MIIALVITKIEVNNGFVIEQIALTIHNGVPGKNNDTIDAFEDDKKILKMQK